MRIGLIRQSNYDQAVRYAVVWLNWFKEEAKSLGHEIVFDIYDGHTLPNDIYRVVEENAPVDFLYYTGHGDTREVTTSLYNGLAFVWWLKDPRYGLDSDNLSGLNNVSNLFLLSCLCGKELLPEISRRLGIATYGFVEEYCWVVDTNYSPEEDPYARSFGIPCNELAKAIASGKSIEECLLVAGNAFDEQIDYWDNWIVNHPDAPREQLVRAKLCVSLLDANKKALVGYKPSVPVEMGVPLGVMLMIFFLVMIVYGIARKSGKI